MELGSLLGTLGGGAAMANPVGMGIAAGAGILKTGLGFLQQAKGRKMLKRTVDPGYKIPKGFGQNLAQAEQMARTGMPSQQYNQAQQNISRNVGTGVRALSRSANPAAGVAGLVRAQNDATLGLDVSNAAAKRQNILQAMGARREMAGQQLAQQQYQQNRYFDKVNEAQARIGAGTQNIFGGISDIGTAGIMSGINKAEGSSGAGGGFLSGLFKGRGRLKELGSGLGKPNPNFNNQAYLQSLGLS
jgi:hypothetical protein